MARHGGPADGAGARVARGTAPPARGDCRARRRAYGAAAHAEATSDRDSWRSEAETLLADRDAWRSEAGALGGDRDAWRREAEALARDRDAWRREAENWRRETLRLVSEHER